MNKLILFVCTYSATTLVAPVLMVTMKVVDLSVHWSTLALLAFMIVLNWIIAKKLNPENLSAE